MHSDAGDTTQLVPGSPIRTPWDHSSVDSSPRPIAASHVLHRLLMPRHPPYALKNLTTKALKMLASTVQFSTNTKPTPLYQPQPDRHRQLVLQQMWISTETSHPLTRLVVSGPNRMPVRPANRIQPRSTPTSLRAVLDGWTVVRETSPVSPPYEHPTNT